MNRLDARFQALRAAGRPGLVTFITAGDPNPEWTDAAMHSVVRHGADVIELGMPFSDPMADGPVIQQANERALAKGVGLVHVLEALRRFRQLDRDTPVVLMGYLNPIERFGFEAFVRAAHAAGADALLLVDCPPEESDGHAALLAELDLHQIFLLAPTSPAARRQRIAARASGFLYYVSFKGITGAGHLEQDSAIVALREVRALTRTPVAVGFGIKDAASAAALGAHADAVVIGSALVESMAPARSEGDLDGRIGAFLDPIAQALRSLRLAA